MSLSVAEIIEECFKIFFDNRSLGSFRLPRPHRLVEQRCHVLLAEPLSGAEDHDPVLDGQSVEVVQHDVVGLRQKGGLARHRGVLEVKVMQFRGGKG